MRTAVRAEPDRSLAIAWPQPLELILEAPYNVLLWIQVPRAVQLNLA